MTNIIPNRDIVPKADWQRGLVQEVECEASFMACHSIARTVATLLRACGNPSGRTIKM